MMRDSRIFLSQHQGAEVPAAAAEANTRLEAALLGHWPVSGFPARVSSGYTAWWRPNVLD